MFISIINSGNLYALYYFLTVYSDVAVGHSVPILGSLNKYFRPDAKFKDYIRSDIFHDEPKKLVLRKEHASYEEVSVAFFMTGVD